ncbi:MAG: hypothetical protein ACLQU2_09395 [Candidatus Binataceae bacterium]
MPNQFCGTGLLDVGISEMFMDLPFAQRSSGYLRLQQPGTSRPDHECPDGQYYNSSPAMSYTYTTVQPPTPPSGPAPIYSQWFDTTQTGQIFVNTGRNPLNTFDYLYDGQCGLVGFKALQ